VAGGYLIGKRVAASSGQVDCGLPEVCFFVYKSRQTPISIGRVEAVGFWQGSRLYGYKITMAALKEGISKTNRVLPNNFFYNHNLGAFNGNLNSF
jgi:hypothetical protein